jgi:hypothetical protein
VRLGRTRCHNHPFTSWKREDFWGQVAIFVGTAPGQVNHGFTQGYNRINT